MRPFLVAVAILGLATFGARVGADEKPVDVAGSWWTSFGMVELKVGKDGITGTYGTAGQYRMEGTIAGKTLKMRLHEDGPAEGQATLVCDESGTVFQGTYEWPNGNRGEWNGVRQDKKGEDGPPTSFAGTWLTGRGPCEFVQNGAKVEGKYPFRGPVQVTGDVKGRRLTLTWRGPTFTGSGWIEMAKDRKSWAGVTKTDGQPGFWPFFGKPLAGYSHKAKPKPGAIVDGLTSNGLAYHVLVPETWAPGKPTPCILVLHGSNMTSKAYVNTIAQAWPDLAKRFAILGIDGETCVESSKPDAPMCNYTYVDFVGKSTFKGFPGTDRESPALVAEAIPGLQKDLSLGKILVGGHSQGGFLAYSLAMNYPALFAGAFPVSCGLIFQAEPSAYEDEAVRAAQRRLPFAIVHARNDDVVSFSMGDYAHQAFLAQGFPALRLFDHPTAAHMFAVLPVRDAILWLDALSSDDPATLAAFADERAAAGAWRDVAAAVVRGKALAKGAAPGRLAALESRLDEQAKAKAAEFAAAIEKNADRSWIDGFLAYREQFEFAGAAKPAMDAFARLRAKHQPEADAREKAGQEAMRSGDEAGGWAAYQEIVDRWYASSWYPVVKRWIAERDAKK